ncbi:MAG: N5-glutamine methyltransferase family protein [Candidatus Paceibacteria bacterium]
MKNQDRRQEITWLLKEKYDGVESEAFMADCQRLAVGEPLGYVIGYVPFLDCEIWLDSCPLIPRAETEFWVEKAISSIKTRAEGSPSPLSEEEPFALRVLDLCAGSGAIGVAVVKAVPEAHVTFAEIDEAHLPTIQKNLNYNLLPYPNRLGYGSEKYSTAQKASSITLSNNKPDSENTIIYDSILAKKFSVVQSDLFEKVEGRFDFILSNPPYIDAKANTVDDNVEKHEPHLALFGGEAGMEIIEKIINEARAKLAPLGQLWIEHEPFQTNAIAKLGEKARFNVVTHTDQYNIPRYSVLTIL